MIEEAGTLLNMWKNTSWLWVSQKYFFHLAMILQLVLNKNNPSTEDSEVSPFLAHKECCFCFHKHCHVYIQQNPQQVRWTSPSLKKNFRKKSRIFSAGPSFACRGDRRCRSAAGQCARKWKMEGVEGFYTDVGCSTLGNLQLSTAQGDTMMCWTKIIIIF